MDPFASISTSAPKSKPTLKDFNSEFDSPVEAPTVKQAASTTSLSLTPSGKQPKFTQTIIPKVTEKKTVEPVIEEEEALPAAAAEPKLFKSDKLNKEMEYGFVNETNHITREVAQKVHAVLVEKINLTKASCDKSIELTKESIEHMCNSTRSATTAMNESVAKMIEAQKAAVLQVVHQFQELGAWVQQQQPKKKKRKHREAEYPSSASEEDDEDTSMSSGSEESEPDPAPIIEKKRRIIPVDAPRVTKKTIEQTNRKAKAAPAKASPVIKSVVAGGRQLPHY